MCKLNILINENGGKLSTVEPCNAIFKSHMDVYFKTLMVRYLNRPRFFLKCDEYGANKL